MHTSFLSIKSLQTMVNICAQFGKRFDVQHNAKKTFCIAFSRAVDLSNVINENNRIYLKGNRLEWKKSVKDLGNHVNYNLSESEEIRHKRGEFIGRVNGLLVQYGDAHPEVQMYLLSAYCCHFYGSQSWDLIDPHILFINTTWNRAVRIIWKLPFHSHKVILSGLNKGQSSWDAIFRRFYKMYECMCSSKNETVFFLAAMSMSDCRSIIARNIKFM